MIIAIDFDGTICRNNYPKIGELYHLAKDVINKLHDEGHHIVIWTCRSGEALVSAISFLMKEGVKFDGINTNTPGNITAHGDDSRKIYADVYIDDRQVGGLPTWSEIYNHIKRLEA